MYVFLTIRVQVKNYVSFTKKKVVCTFSKQIDLKRKAKSKLKVIYALWHQHFLQIVANRYPIQYVSILVDVYLRYFTSKVPRGTPKIQ